MIIRFKPGVDFVQETPDGRSVNSVITIEGNKLHEVQKDDGGKDTVIDRVFTDSEVKMVRKIKNFQTKKFNRLFFRIKE